MGPPALGLGAGAREELVQAGAAGHRINLGTLDPGTATLEQGRIGVLQRQYGLARCPGHGATGVERRVGRGVLTAHLVTIARATTGRTPRCCATCGRVFTFFVQDAGLTPRLPWRWAGSPADPGPSQRNQTGKPGMGRS